MSRVIVSAFRIWFCLGLAICFVGMLLGFREAYALAAVFGGIVFLLGRILSSA